MDPCHYQKGVRRKNRYGHEKYEKHQEMLGNNEI
jgi:hypothetical protein